MPQLDRFLSVMVGNRADALLLREGSAVQLEIGGSPRPITKAPLTAQQVVGLIREIVPAELARQLEGAQPVSFRYTSPDGAFTVRAVPDGGRRLFSIALDGSAATRPSPAANGAGGNGHAARPTPHGGAAVRPTPNGMAAIPTPNVMAAIPTPTPAIPPVHTPMHGVGALPTPHASPVVAFEAAPVDEAAKARIEQLLRLLVERSASDLHLRVGEPPILRQHGEMQRIGDMPVLNDQELSAMLLSIMPARNQKEYRELNDTDFAHEIEGCARFRANALRERKGAAAVFRVIPAQVVNVEQLGLSQEVQNLCYLTKGLVLVTGPTGSGKSTTLCAMVDLVNRMRDDHVITIEDPIEFVHPNKKCIITQRQVGVHTSSFKHALRAALREDPDIVLVGELRDLETVSTAIETAETGHLVFGTLHTTTAPSTIDRIIDQFPPDRQEQIRVMLSESLKGVISQTLCKKIGGGRVAAREILLTIPAISNLIREGKTFQIPSILQTSRRLGMITLNDALIELVDAGQVEPKEAYMKSVEKIGFLNQLKSRGHDTSFVDGDPAAAAAPPSKPEPAKPAAKAAKK